MELELTDYEGGVARLYFSKQFARALHEHVKIEFPLLRDRLPKMQAGFTS